MVKIRKFLERIFLRSRLFRCKVCEKEFFGEFEHDLILDMQGEYPYKVPICPLCSSEDTEFIRYASFLSYLKIDNEASASILSGIWFLLALITYWIVGEKNIFIEPKWIKFLIFPSFLLPAFIFYGIEIRRFLKHTQKALEREYPDKASIIIAETRGFIRRSLVWFLKIPFYGLCVAPIILIIIFIPLIPLGIVGFFIELIKAAIEIVK